jgi:hypothetical protein
VAITLGTLRAKRRAAAEKDEVAAKDVMSAMLKNFSRVYAETRA